MFNGDYGSGGDEQGNGNGSTNGQNDGNGQGTQERAGTALTNGQNDDNGQRGTTQATNNVSGQEHSNANKNSGNRSPFIPDLRSIFARTQCSLQRDCALNLADLYASRPPNAVALNNQQIASVPAFQPYEMRSFQGPDLQTSERRMVRGQPPCVAQPSTCVPIIAPTANNVSPPAVAVRPSAFMGTLLPVGRQYFEFHTRMAPGQRSNNIRRAVDRRRQFDARRLSFSRFVPMCDQSTAPRVQQLGPIEARQLTANQRAKVEHRQTPSSDQEPGEPEISEGHSSSDDSEIKGL